MKKSNLFTLLILVILSACTLDQNSPLPPNGQNPPVHVPKYMIYGHVNGNIYAKRLGIADTNTFEISTCSGVPSTSASFDYVLDVEKLSNKLIYLTFYFDDNNNGKWDQYDVEHESYYMLTN